MSLKRLPVPVPHNCVQHFIGDVAGPRARLACGHGLDVHAICRAHTRHETTSRLSLSSERRYTIIVLLQVAVLQAMHACRARPCMWLCPTHRKHAWVAGT